MKILVKVSLSAYNRQSASFDVWFRATGNTLDTVYEADIRDFNTPYSTTIVVNPVGNVNRCYTFFKESLEPIPLKTPLEDFL